MEATTQLADPATSRESRGRVRWAHVACFYLIACAWSWPFFWWRDVRDWAGFDAPPLVHSLLIMWGPGVAALAGYWIFRRRLRRGVGLLGVAPARSLLFAFLPFPVFAALGVLSPSDGNALLSAVVTVGGVFALMLGEELGWRGFLQDALRPLPIFARFALVGVLWEAWHFTTRTYGRPVPQAAFVVTAAVVLAVAVSLVFGLVVERTRSLLVAAGLHFVVNVLLENIDRPNPASLAGVGVVVVLWSLLLWRWERPLLAAPRADTL